MEDRDRAALGRRAEALVASYLEERGYVVVARNARVGRLEIDIIARKRSLLVICEVRSRSTDRWLAPVETIDARKAQRIRRAAQQWLSQSHLGGLDVRFDAASVVFDRPAGRIEYYEAAF